MNTAYPRTSYSMTWRPAAAAPRLPSPFMGSGKRSLGAAKTGLEAFAESPILALTSDVIAAGSSAYLAWALGVWKNEWSTFWWIVTAAITVKGLHDLARIRVTSE